MPHVVLSVTGVVGDDVPKAWESVGRDEAEMLFVCRCDKVTASLFIQRRMVAVPENSDIQQAIELGHGQVKRHDHLTDEVGGFIGELLLSFVSYMQCAVCLPRELRSLRVFFAVIQPLKYQLISPNSKDAGGQPIVDVSNQFVEIL